MSQETPTTTRRDPWLERLLTPISKDAPAGTAASEDAAYEAVLGEIERPESIATAGTVRWKVVVSGAEELLASRTKDLTLAVYLAVGLHKVEGLAGLARGLTLIAGLLDRYWETMQPPLRRLRGRTSWIVWLLERARPAALSEIERAPVQRDELHALKRATRAFSAAVLATFGASAPPVQGFARAVERAIEALPAPRSATSPTLEPTPQAGASARAQPPTTSSPSTTAASSTGPAPSTMSITSTRTNEQTTRSSSDGARDTGGAAQARPATVTTGTDPEVREPPASTNAAATLQLPAVTPVKNTLNPDDEGTIRKTLRGLGEALVGAGVAICRARPHDPLGYRLRFTGLWLPVTEAPPSEHGKTRLRAVDLRARREVERLADTGDWSSVITRCDGLLKGHRLSLDLTRQIVDAMRELGPEYDDARAAIERCARDLLARCEDLVALRTADDTPFADEETRRWLHGLEAPTGRVNPADSSEADATVIEEGSALQRARAASGAEALEILARAIAGASDGATRFQARVEQARVCVRAGAPEVASRIYAQLDREIVARNLDDWDPPLAAEVRGEFLRCAAALSVETRDRLGVVNALDRHCEHQPARALALFHDIAALRERATRTR